MRNLRLAPAEVAVSACGGRGFREHLDQYVAHADGKPVAELATFEALNTAITAIGDLFREGRGRNHCLR
jgi:hypothetical protein